LTRLGVFSHPRRRAELTLHPPEGTIVAWGTRGIPNTIGTLTAGFYDSAEIGTPAQAHPASDLMGGGIVDIRLRFRDL
jgi:hypothetical protein